MERQIFIREFKVIYGGLCPWLGRCRRCGSILEVSEGVQTQGTDSAAKGKLVLIAVCSACKSRAKTDVHACTQCGGWYLLRGHRGICLCCGYSEWQGRPSGFPCVDQALAFGQEMNLRKYPGGH
jgi:hypothetical protein